jgi:hypothetical protein
LQARKLHVERGGEGFDSEGLGQAGHAFEQDVAVGEQTDDQPFSQIIR